MTPTTTVQLKHGYIDDQGKAHKEAVIRLPLMDDEIKAAGQQEIEKAKNNPEGASDSYYETALLAQCLISIGGVRPITVTHLRTMRRQDVRAMLTALYKLEAADTLDDEAKNDPASAR